MRHFTFVLFTGQHNLQSEVDETATNLRVSSEKISSHRKIGVRGAALDARSVVLLELSKCKC